MKKAFAFLYGWLYYLTALSTRGPALWSAQITDNMERMEIDGLYGQSLECVYWVDKMMGFSLLGIRSFKPLSLDLTELSPLSLPVSIIFCLSSSDLCIALYYTLHFLPLCVSLSCFLSLFVYHVASLSRPLFFLNAAVQSVREIRWLESSGFMTLPVVF